MISRAYIIEWRNSAPWILDSQVEHDLILNRLLVELFSNKIFSNALILRGGTALYKIYFKNKVIRFSEDIDLVQIKNEPIGDLMTVSRTICNPVLGTPKYKQTQGRVTFYYKTMSEISPIVPLKFKIEISTIEHYSLFKKVRKEFNMVSRWFSGDTILKTYSINELMGTKMRALYQRRKGRDLFDLWYVLTNYKCNIDKIILAFKFYLDKQYLKISKSEYIKNLEKKLDDSQFLNDTKNILSPNLDFDYKKACELIFDKLIHHI